MCQDFKLNADLVGQSPPRVAAADEGGWRPGTVWEAPRVSGALTGAGLETGSANVSFVACAGKHSFFLVKLHQSKLWC